METNGAVDTIKGLAGSSDPFVFALSLSISKAKTHYYVLCSQKEEDAAKHFIPFKMEDFDSFCLRNSHLSHCILNELKKYLITKMTIKFDVNVM